jgi:peptidoglycan/xylan/chitin deacetylase (PgdA/CDA1 family)
MRGASWLAVGLDRAFGPRSAGRLGMITYHRIAPKPPRLPPPAHNVTPERFRCHLRGLLARGFNVWPLRQVLDYRQRGLALPPRTIVLTFDDGFQTLFTEAWPVLRELGLPATVFLCTAYLDSDAPFPFDCWGQRYCQSVPPHMYRPLTTAQCRQMADSGLIELAAHSHTHQDLRAHPDRFREDVRISIDILRSVFGVADATFAFPVGSIHDGFAGPLLAEAARQAGAACGLTTDCHLIDLKSDPFQWGRFNAFSWDTDATLAAKLDGWYSWAADLKRGVARRPAGVFHAKDPNL